MGDTDNSKKFLTQTLPAIIGPGLLLLMALGIWRIAVLTAELDAQGIAVAEIPQLAQNAAASATQLAIIANDVAQLRQLTQGLDGSLRPEGTLSAEMKALQGAMADQGRQEAATRAQLDSLIQALGKEHRP